MSGAVCRDGVSESGQFGVTYEEMERTTQSILEQQAQISASVQRHDEHLRRIETNLERLGGNPDRLEDVVLKLATLTSCS